MVTEKEYRLAKVLSILSTLMLVVSLIMLIVTIVDYTKNVSHNYTFFMALINIAVFSLTLLNSLRTINNYKKGMKQ